MYLFVTPFPENNPAGAGKWSCDFRQQRLSVGAFDNGGMAKSAPIAAAFGGGEGVSAAEQLGDARYRPSGPSLLASNYTEACAKGGEILLTLIGVASPAVASARSSALLWRISINEENRHFVKNAGRIDVCANRPLAYQPYIKLKAISPSGISDRAKIAGNW